MQTLKDIILGIIYLIVFVVVSHCDRANSESLYLGAWSDHPFSDSEWNETHDLLAYENNGVIAGRFTNSFNDESYFLAKSYRYYDRNNFQVRVYIGGVTGYRRCWLEKELNFCPIIFPEVSYTKYRVQPAVLLVGEAVAITFKLTF